MKQFTAKNECRCHAILTLKDGSKVDCRRRAVEKNLCKQHLKLSKQRKIEQW